MLYDSEFGTGARREQSIPTNPKKTKDQTVMTMFKALTRQSLFKILPRDYSSGTVQNKPQSDLPSGFWPPGPPPFHADPAILAESTRLYTSILRHYKLLGKKPREEWRDPWAKREDWRYHPYFSGVNVVKNAVPGLSWALVAFGIYCGYEHLSK